MFFFLFTGFQHRPILKQGFIHIIVYDVDSVKGAIADATGRTKNKRVYYPSDKGVDKDAVIQQFLDQLLFREGNWRSPIRRALLLSSLGPSLRSARSMSWRCPMGIQTMKKMETSVMKVSYAFSVSVVTLLVLLLETPNGQQNDRESIMKCLDGIDSKFLDLTPVKNLSIDFTKSSCGSIKTNQLLITSLFASSNQESLPEQVSILTSLNSKYTDFLYV
jgi:hypothetical protein